MGDSMLGDIWEGVSKVKDVIGLGEVGMMLGTGKTSVLTPGAEKVMGPVGAVIDGATLGYGAAEMATGMQDDYNPQTWDGLDKVISGGAGALGNIPGPVGAVAKAFGAGYTVGDWIAPLVYGSEEEANKPHMEQVPEDGIFKPTTGNSVVDWMFGVD